MIQIIIQEKLGVSNPQDWEGYLDDINLGFNKIKLEKDFYLTIILNRIADNLPDLIFK